MIRYSFKVKNYCKVIVFFDLDYNFFDIVSRELFSAGFCVQLIEDLYYNMFMKKAKAVTCSSINNHVSIVIFNPHERIDDYINSIVHEAEHVKQAMLSAYNIKDKGEDPAYTIGYLVMNIYRGFCRRNY